MTRQLRAADGEEHRRFLESGQDSKISEEPIQGGSSDSTLVVEMVMLLYVCEVHTITAWSDRAFLKLGWVRGE